MTTDTFKTKKERIFAGLEQGNPGLIVGGLSKKARKVRQEVPVTARVQCLFTYPFKGRIFLKND